MLQGTARTQAREARQDGEGMCNQGIGRHMQELIIVSLDGRTKYI